MVGQRMIVFFLLKVDNVATKEINGLFPAEAGMLVLLTENQLICASELRM